MSPVLMLHVGQLGKVNVGEPIQDAMHRLALCLHHVAHPASVLKINHITLRHYNLIGHGELAKESCSDLKCLVKTFENF